MGCVKPQEKACCSDSRFRRKLSGTTGHRLLGTQRPQMLCVAAWDWFCLSTEFVVVPLVGERPQKTLSGRPTQFASETGVGTTGRFLCSNGCMITSRNRGTCRVIQHPVNRLRTRGDVKEKQVTHTNTRQEQHRKRPHEEPHPSLDNNRRWRGDGDSYDRKRRLVLYISLFHLDGLTLVIKNAG